jgi:putative ABC transport system permease protein
VDRLNDLRFALRSLRRSPLFAITSVLTLALGIALVTAAFSLVDSVLIRPLPFARPDQIVTLAERNGQGQITGVGYPNFVDWQAQDANGAFAGMAYARGRGLVMQQPEGPQSVLGAFVSAGFFKVVQPDVMLGRLFNPGEEQQGEHVAVLSYSLWRGTFGGDRGVLGKKLALSEGSYTVIGVLRRGADYPQFAQMYLPLAAVAATDKVLSARGFHADSRAVARLKPGMTMARSQTELSAIAKRLAVAYPAENADWPSVSVLPLTVELIGSTGARLTVLAAAMALVLLIAWVNVTNLALVRATSRTRELAIRTSLGASRRRIIRPVLAEQGIIGVAACVIGSIAATWVLGMVRSLGAGTPGSAMVRIDGRALAFAALTSLISVLVIGTLPAMRAARVSLTEPLKEGAGGAGRSGRQQRARSALVVGEIALALMLVIGAGLLVRSFWRLNNVDAGFNTHNLVAIDLSPPGRQYAEPAQTGAFYSRLLDAVRAVPGVDAVALTNHMPLNGSALPVSVQIAGRAPDPEHDPQVLFRTISPEYIGTLGIPLRSGRNFAPADLTSGTAVLVNQRFAASYWPGANPIGRQVMLHKSAQGFADLGEPLPGIVVGVIGDVRHYGIQADPVAEIYIPYLRNPWGHMVVVSRVRGNPQAMIPGLRRAILSVDPATRVDGGTFGGFAVMDDVRDGGSSAARFNMTLLASFSLCALLLSAIGIYGLMAYAVAQRTREMGIRMALGARGSDVRHLILASGMRLILLGVIVGLAGAVGLTRLASSLLFGVSATDPLTFGMMTLVLTAVALLACYLPARRASRVDPVVALRSE